MEVDEEDTSGRVAVGASGPSAPGAGPLARPVLPPAMPYPAAPQAAYVLLVKASAMPRQPSA
eukprot:15225012-Alexandrium_andersonii.AAC.1